MAWRWDPFFWACVGPLVLVRIALLALRSALRVVWMTRIWAGTHTWGDNWQIVQMYGYGLHFPRLWLHWWWADFSTTVRIEALAAALNRFPSD